MGQHECMVGSLSVPNRIESVVLSASCGLDVVDFFSLTSSITPKEAKRSQFNFSPGT